MISAEGISIEFGIKPLFKNASFVVNDRDRIALVGKNGAGKSTLLKVICGMVKPTAGRIEIPSDTTIGYLPQVMQLADDTTVIEETHKAFDYIKTLKAKIDSINEQLTLRSDYESVEYLELVNRFTSLHDRYQILGANGYEAEAERTLTGLGFRKSDFHRPTREFSGGWRMRIELAKILLKKPDVLLLDEPTNHLDIESIQWLEHFLATSAKAAVIVSHDRAFINNVTERTLDITCGNIVDYNVKYDQYVVLRQERRAQQLRAFENQQKEIAEATDFINRFRYKPSKAVQVQQKIKQLEKIVPVEVDEVDNSRMHLKFPPCTRSGDYPVICQDVKKVYAINTSADNAGAGSEKQSHLVFSDVNLTIKRGEKVAFVGRNGEGKTTLVKCIMGEIDYNGRLTVGHNVQIGYFAQNQAQLLDEQITVYDTIDSVAKGPMRLKINDILGAFMFGGEESEKKVKVLSGGERSRLAMIKLLLEPVNMLILDEPTNHLDMVSKDILKEAIKEFDGTVIVVSHDREFLDGLVSKVYEFADGRVREHLGGIYDFLRSRSNDLQMRGDRMEFAAKPSTNAQQPKTATPTAQKEQKSASQQSYAERKEQQKRIRKAERLVEEAEKRIALLEQKLKQLDLMLMQPDKASDMQLVNDYTTTKSMLDKEVDEWERLSEELDTLSLS